MQNIDQTIEVTLAPRLRTVRGHGVASIRFLLREEGECASS
jgi:hypothetical protein